MAKHTNGDDPNRLDIQKIEPNPEKKNRPFVQMRKGTQKSLSMRLAT